MKIKFTFTPSEMRALFEVLRSIRIENSGMEQLAIQEVVLALIMKLQRKMLCLKKKNTLSLSMVECYFLYKIFMQIQHKHTVFERTLLMEVCNTIHQKTI